MAKSESVELQLRTILEQYGKEVESKAGDAFESVAKEGVSKLKSTSPKRKGKYARAWTMTREQTRGAIDSVVIHNKRYQLTHLLENGHVIRNAKGTYGRVAGIKHIAPVEDWAAEELPEAVKRAIE